MEKEEVTFPFLVNDACSNMVDNLLSADVWRGSGYLHVWMGWTPEAQGRAVEGHCGKAVVSRERAELGIVLLAVRSAHSLSWESPGFRHNKLPPKMPHWLRQWDGLVLFSVSYKNEWSVSESTPCALWKTSNLKAFWRRLRVTPFILGHCGHHP